MKKLELGFYENELEEVKWRWEFIRRIPEYKKDYSVLIKRNPGIFDRLYVQRTKDKSFFDKKFCSKWRLGRVFDPELSFEDLLNSYKKKIKSFDNPSVALEPLGFNSDPYRHTEEYLILLPTLEKKMSHKKREELIEKCAKVSLYSNIKPDTYFIPVSPVSGAIKLEELKKFKRNGKLDVTINFNFSPNAIKKEFKKFVSFWHKKYDRNKSKKNIVSQQAIPRERNEFKHYGNFLKVWDLVQEKGRKWTEIAKGVFPNDFKELDSFSDDETIDMPNPETAITKVKNYFKEVEKLMEEMRKN